MNQLAVQIQEFPDKVSALDDSRVFFGPETASNSGLSPRGMLSRDTCLQPDTRNSLGISGNVFLKIYLQRMNGPQHQHNASPCL